LVEIDISVNRLHYLGAVKLRHNISNKTCKCVYLFFRAQHTQTLFIIRKTNIIRKIHPNQDNATYIYRLSQMHGPKCPLVVKRSGHASAPTILWMYYKEIFGIGENIKANHFLIDIVNNR